ncbi:MAG: GGDEF domain-containing response regulator [Acidobacteriota bacterium]|nr:GGDEF domain-containing response regulator [Acidobacteriota bacterium]
MSAFIKSTERQGSSARDQGRILLITDDPTLDLGGAELERAGFTVVGVTGGAKALVAIQRSRPHLVVAAVELKKISAGELALLLGQTQDGIPLLLVGSGGATLELRRDAFTFGAFDYFELPAERELFTARVAHLIAIKQSMDNLRVEAERDFLTGLSNRRRFRLALSHEVERWRRYDVACSLLLIDIDNLKTINDTFGHPAGDVVICHAANAITQSTRGNDTAARLGGEEFALLLAGADSAKAVLAAERLRRSIATKAIDGVGNVTVSIGVAACPTHANSERALYAASDVALYQAKSSGRNQVAVTDAIS